MLREIHIWGTYIPHLTHFIHEWMYFELIDWYNRFVAGCWPEWSRSDWAALATYIPLRVTEPPRLRGIPALLRSDPATQAAVALNCPSGPILPIFSMSGMAEVQLVVTRVVRGGGAARQICGPAGSNGAQGSRCTRGQFCCSAGRHGPPHSADKIN